jgi:hypothetical protein
MKQKSFRPAFLTAGILLLFLSCAGSPNVYEQIDAGVLTGSYQSALASLDDEGGAARKNVYTSKNEILLYLDLFMKNKCWLTSRTTKNTTSKHKNF